MQFISIRELHAEIETDGRSGKNPIAQIAKRISEWSGSIEPIYESSVGVKHPTILLCCVIHLVLRWLKGLIIQVRVRYNIFAKLKVLPTEKLTKKAMIVELGSGRKIIYGYSAHQHLLR